MSLLSDNVNPILKAQSQKTANWFSWSQEALTKAAKENKPILLVVISNSSKWSHCMLQSYEDPQVAEFLNDDFVPIMVDQDELPYIAVPCKVLCQQITNSVGWPLNVFLTPDLKPIFASAYMPLKSQGRTPGLSDVLPRVKWLWLTSYDKVIEASKTYEEKLVKALSASAGPIPENFETLILTQLAIEFDRDYGGFGEFPKFLSAPKLLTLCELAEGNVDAQNMLDTTLSHMAAGAIHDVLGGGFHSYTVDRQWKSPRFGKFLLDNSMMAYVYARAFGIFRSPTYWHMADECIAMILNTLNLSGLFATGEDLKDLDVLDSYYLWSYDEIKKILGSDADLFIRAYGITKEGNFCDGQNVFYIENIAGVVADSQMTFEDAWEILFKCRQKLHSSRLRRKHPPIQHEIITHYNATFIAALAKASQTMDKANYLKLAVNVMDKLSFAMVKDGELYRSRFGEHLGEKACLDDYSAMAWANIELHLGTKEDFWLDMAKLWIDRAVELFGSSLDSNGAMSTNSKEMLSIVDVVDAVDGVGLSGNAIMANNFYNLWKLTGDVKYKSYLDSMMESFGTDLKNFSLSLAGLSEVALKLLKETKTTKPKRKR